MVTQKYIAKRLDVSQTAVACAFHPTLHRHLSPRKRQRILDMAGRLGYVPNHAARRLVRSRFRKPSDQFDQVGLMYLVGGDVGLDSACIAIMRGAEQELSRLHASLTFVRANEPADWKKVDRMERSGNVDGWLLVGTVDDAVVRRLKRGRLPFVILGDHQCAQPVHSVNVDASAAGRLAVEYLASLGHRCIGFMGGSMRHDYQRRMLGGFSAAVRDLKLEEDGRLITDRSSWNCGTGGRGIFEFDEGQVARWLKGSRATALFLPEFNEAPEMWRALRQLQMDVPRDISLLACEQGSLGSMRRNFTCIEMSMHEVGRHGVLMLHRLATAGTASGGDANPSWVRLAPSLTEGWSVGPCEPGKAAAGKTAFGRWKRGGK